MRGAECLLGVAHGVCNRVPLSWNNCRFARTLSVTFSTTPTSSAVENVNADFGTNKTCKACHTQLHGLTWTGQKYYSQHVTMMGVNLMLANKTAGQALTIQQLRQELHAGKQMTKRCNGDMVCSRSPPGLLETNSSVRSGSWL